MASRWLYALAASTLCCFVLAIADTDPLLDGINKYRTETVGIGALSTNAGANCVAKKLLSEYEGKECSNSTGLDTVPGQEPNYPDFLTWLSDCGVSTDSVKDARILPDCVPSSIDASSVASAAVANYTESAGAAINDTDYTSAGVATVKNWYVLILATNSSTGDYLQQQGSDATSLFASLACTVVMPFLSFFVYGMW